MWELENRSGNHVVFDSRQDKMLAVNYRTISSRVRSAQNTYRTPDHDVLLTVNKCVFSSVVLQKHALLFW